MYGGFFKSEPLARAHADALALDIPDLTVLILRWQPTNYEVFVPMSDYERDIALAKLAESDGEQI